MKKVFRFWAKGTAGGIKVKAEGEVIVEEPNEFTKAAEEALRIVQETWPDFVQDNPFKNHLPLSTTYPTIRFMPDKTAKLNAN